MSPSTKKRFLSFCLLSPQCCCNMHLVYEHRRSCCVRVHACFQEHQAPFSQDLLHLLCPLQSGVPAKAKFSELNHLSLSIHRFAQKCRTQNEDTHTFSESQINGIVSATIPPCDDCRIIFEATSASPSSSYIAVTNINIQPNACPLEVDSCDAQDTFR